MGGRRPVFSNASSRMEMSVPAHRVWVARRLHGGRGQRYLSLQEARFSDPHSKKSSLYHCQESSRANVALAAAISCRHRARDSSILPYPFAKELMGVDRRMDKTRAGASRSPAKKKQDPEKQESRPSLPQAVLRSILSSLTDAILFAASKANLSKAWTRIQGRT